MMESSNIKRLIPLLSRVLVKRAEPVNQTRSGIQLPAKKAHEVLHGTVVAIGPGKRTDNGTHLEPLLKIGDHVLLPDYGGTKIQANDGQSYQLYQEHEILAKVHQ